MTYPQAIDFLNSNFVSYQTVGRAAYREGLEAITQMCRAMGNPQLGYLTVHVAGTNGKGSVAHILAAVLQAAGYRTGLFTSPHLFDFRERIRVDGEMISESGVAEFITSRGEDMRRMGLSYFDMTTAMALEWFAQSDVEIAVIETGLGGRLDSTNVVSPVLSVITNVGLEHTDILGDTLAKIATEKAGIIKPRIPVLIGESSPETDDVFIARARELASPITFAEDVYECAGSAPGNGFTSYTLARRGTDRLQSLDLDLQGDYQRSNIVTARAALGIIEAVTPINISFRALREGMRHAARTTGLRGRWEVLSDSPFTVADAGHNAHGMRRVGSALADALASRKYANLHIVIGFAADKDLAEILPLLPAAAHYIFTQAASPRALPAAALAATAASYGLRGEVVPVAADALAAARAVAAPADMIFVGGSIYLLAEVL